MANAAGGDDVVEHGIANAAGDDDVELGNNIQDTVKFLLLLTQNSTDETIPPASIYWIPKKIRDRCPKAFTPRVVSIGPFYIDDENLQRFEKQKAIFVRDVLGSGESGPSPEDTLETCVQKMYGSMKRIRACYEYQMGLYDDHDVATMMVMDACFILELCYKISGFSFSSAEKTVRMLPPGIFHDLLLIENQIPFFVLQDIFECIAFRFKTETKTKTFSLNELIISLFEVVSIFDSDLSIENFEKKPDHILGVLHKYYQPPLPLTDSYPSILGRSHSVVELDRAGVNFKPHSYFAPPQWVMDIKLEPPRWRLPWSKPTIKIPTLFIEDDTGLILRNLIAYEQLSPEVRNYVTSYVTAMDLLINNAEDVAILVESNVLRIMSSNEDAASMINDLGKETPLTEFLYNKEWTDLDKHYNRILPKHIESFTRAYCKSPWNLLALVGAILLFVLTMVQTYYTINPVQTNSSGEVKEPTGFIL